MWPRTVWTGKRTMDLQIVFLYLVLLAVALWTARLAMSKGRNAWGWGGAALLLSLMPWHLLGVVPVLVLLFIKRPATAPALDKDRLSCARCAKSYSEGQHFCTGCGWDLNEAYSPEEPEGAQASPAQPQTQTTMPATSVAQPPETAPEKSDVSAVEAPVVETETAKVTEAPAADTAQVAAEESGGSSEAESPEAEGEPEQEHVPWGTFEPGPAPTAAIMTSRGIEQFDEGKYQEAIDQFTKAIALDPKYADAWQRRAEAYAQLGRSEQAAKDRQHLQGLDPSSSPG